MYPGFRSPHLSVDSHGAPRSSISTDFSETSSFLSSAASNLSSVVGEFSVLCLHDYQPTDPDQLGFRKGDILAILKTEDTGWWAAAMGSTIGWVPRGYVEPISDAMAETLKSVRRDLRANTADWDSASIAGPSTSSLRSSFSYSTGSSIARDTDWDPPRHTLPSGTDDVPSRSFAAGISSSHSSLTASTPPTHPSSPAQGYVFDPTSDPSGSRSPRITSRSHGYSNSTSSIPPRSRPVPIAGQQVETQRGILASPPSRKNSRADEDSLAFRNAQLAQAALPYYLKPTFRDGYICLEQDGTVKSGTLEALVERLTVDHLKRSHEQLFRMAFLMTYRTFTDAATVFDLLTERYLMDHPPELDEAQFAEWKEKKLRPTQIRVLTTLTEWVERYRFVKDERDMVDKLIEFLNLIKLPAANALTAKQLLEMIDKKISPVSSSTSIPQPTPSKKILGGGKKSKPHKNDITKIDPLELAQHLTLIEYRLFSQIRPSECMYWSKAQHGPQVENLNKFCATSDRLANWVKYSILSLDSLGKRADVVAQWIKIAEKCRGLNNLSSMTAIVAALSSIVITKLSVTWSHVGRSSHLENLRRLTDQSGNFAAFRNFYASVETSCVPYIGIYLNALIVIAEQHKETIIVATPPTKTPSSPGSGSFSWSAPPVVGSPGSHHSRSSAGTVKHINFVRLSKSAEVIHQMLRHQSRPYVQTNPSPTIVASGGVVHQVPPEHPHSQSSINLGAENVAIMSYVDNMLTTGGLGNSSTGSPPGPPSAGSTSTHVGATDQWYWQRSHELHIKEIETADIRKGLEASGF